MGKLVFTEHLALLVEPAGEVVMKVKHFTPEFVGWEEKDGAVRFVLEEAKPDEARFKGLNIRRDGERLDFLLRLRHADGVREEPITMTRVRQL